MLDTYINYILYTLYYILYTTHCTASVQCTPVVRNNDQHLVAIIAFASSVESCSRSLQ